MSTHADRLILGNAAVLTIRTAARLIPLRDSDARKWLRASGLIRSLDGRELIVWGDVVALLTAT